MYVYVSSQKKRLFIAQVLVDVCEYLSRSAITMVTDVTQ